MICICGHAPTLHRDGEMCDACPCFRFRSSARTPVQESDADCAAKIALHRASPASERVQ